MPATSIQSPFPIFTDIDGQPLESGLIWLGTAGNNPISSPITAYWDAALTQVVTQPVTTRGGYPLNGTAVGRLYVNADYSILVRNRSGSDVLSALNATERYDSSLVTFIQAGAGAVTRTAQAKMREVVSVKDFGAVGDGVADDTVAIQAAFDTIGAITAGDYQDITPRGVTLYFPAGRYLVRSTLYMPSNVRMQGTGMGTQFKFDPTVAGSHFLQRKNNNAGGSALNRSNFSMHFENFYVFAARNGGTTTGRSGGSIATINTNAEDCFNLLDCAYSSFTNVTVTDFWYGKAFNIRLGSLFAYYNYMIGCFTRDCELSVQVTSACHITDCYFSHGVEFPPPALQPSVQYAVSFDGFRGCSMQGGSIECSCSVALIKNNGAGHTVTGVYMESFGSTPAMMDCSFLAADAGGILLGGNSYGYTGNITYQENITRGGGYNFTYGTAFGYGDCDEVELEHVSTRQSPSFVEGLPGSAQFPAGGTLTISTDSFIGNTSMALTRGAGTAATSNQMSYNFKVRQSDKVLANIWVTCLVKLEGGENNFNIRTFDATNGNSYFVKLLTFNNGWQLWGTYLRRVDNGTVTFYAEQSAGSTDASKILKVTALRAYTNGFKPIPGPYKWQEFWTAAPTTGTWEHGDIVWNSQPSAGGIPGWVCTTAGTPGTWKAMANLAP